jgi:hypothetical protein
LPSSSFAIIVDFVIIDSNLKGDKRVDAIMA